MSVVPDRACGTRAVPLGDASFATDWARANPAALRFLPRHASSEHAWEVRVEEAARISPSREVWEAAGAVGERLGAGQASRRGVDLLARGDALCVVAGQQPGVFGGPLYTLYKAMTAVALARDLTGKLNRAVVPVFWNASDDSDFGEVATTRLPDRALRSMRCTLRGADLPAGAMVGSMDTAATLLALGEVNGFQDFGPGGEFFSRTVRDALSVAADHGQMAAALLHRLLEGSGLVVVDGRSAELRHAARDLFERYAEHMAEVGDAVAVRGRDLEAAGYTAPVDDRAGRSALFLLADGRRLRFEGTPGELAGVIARDPAAVSPNVVLRPMVQDTVLPNVATVAGPGEIAYHAQIAPAYDLLGVTMAIPFPRLSATLVPRGVFELAERRGASAWDFVQDFDGALRRTVDRALPGGLADGLRRLEKSLESTTREVGHEASAFDARLSGAVDEADRRMREAASRLREKVAVAARRVEIGRDPGIRAYREFLRPRGIGQERVLGCATLPLLAGRTFAHCLAAPLDAHLRAVRAAEPAHWLVDMEEWTPEAGA